MSVLLQIRKQIETADADVARLEQAIVEYPTYPSIAANLESAVRIRDSLRAQFIEAAAGVGAEVCRYRAFDDHDRPVAAAAFAAIADFQRLVSVVYGAIRYGYKQRASVSAALAKESAFCFGYAFTGSIGIVLTMPKTLLDDPTIDESINAIFDMAKASGPDEVKSFAEKLGPGAINALYRWADDNASNGLGADIEWRRPGNSIRSLFVQRQELSKLRRAIKETHSETTEEIAVEGILTAADVTKKRFKLKRDGLSEIKGTFDPDAIDEKHAVTLPHKYVAEILKTTIYRFSKGDALIRYHLTKLRSPQTRSDETTIAM